MPVLKGRYSYAIVFLNRRTDGTPSEVETNIICFTTFGIPTPLFSGDRGTNIIFYLNESFCGKAAAAC